MPFLSPGPLPSKIPSCAPVGYKFGLVDGKVRNDKLWTDHLLDMSECESDSESESECGSREIQVYARGCKKRKPRGNRGQLHARDRV